MSLSTKLCRPCDTEKPLSDFYISRTRGGHASQCISCTQAKARAWHKANSERSSALHRRTNLRLNYGMSLEEYNEMLAGQDGVCRICQEPCPSGRSLAVDHSHVSGAVRGLLCCNCNRALGLMQDTPERLEAAAAYLRLHASTLHRTTDDARQH